MKKSSSSSFSIRSMLAWVGRWLLHPSRYWASAFSRCRVCISFCTTWFQVFHSLPLPAALHITKLLHLLSQFSVSLLCGQTNWVAFAAWPQKCPVFLTYLVFLQGSSLIQTDATHLSSHLHFCPLEFADIFYLNRPCFNAIYHSTLDTNFIDSLSFYGKTPWMSKMAVTT